jgi:hypothetical protein
MAPSFSMTSTSLLGTDSTSFLRWSLLFILVTHSLMILLSFLHVGAGDLPELKLYPGPHIFYRVKIWRVALPLDELDAGSFGKPLSD